MRNYKRLGKFILFCGPTENHSNSPRALVCLLAAQRQYDSPLFHLTLISEGNGRKFSSWKLERVPCHWSDCCISGLLLAFFGQTWLFSEYSELRMPHGIRFVVYCM